MSAWWQERMTVLDLETTSADPETARIVTAAVGYLSGGQPTDIATLVSAVDVDIPAEATAVHGWTTERARAEGQSPEDVLDIILGYLDRRPAGSAVVVFNAPYDLTVLDCECRRLGVTPWQSLAFYVVDPMIVDRHLERYRRGSRKLMDSCRYWRAVLPSAHQAGHDAVAAARLAWRMGTAGKVCRRPRNPEEWAELNRLEAEWELVRGDLALLHDAQARWALDQQTQLERYLHEGNPAKGVPAQPDRVVPKGWPLYPARMESPA